MFSIIDKFYLDHDTEMKHLKTYMEKKALIKKHNFEASQGMHSFFLKMNKYGDMVSIGYAIPVNHLLV